MKEHEDADTSLLSRKKLARLLGVHPETIKRAERSGQLPALRFNSRLTRYRREDVEAWLSRAQLKSRLPFPKAA